MPWHSAEECCFVLVTRNAINHSTAWHFHHFLFARTFPTLVGVVVVVVASTRQSPSARNLLFFVLLYAIPFGAALRSGQAEEEGYYPAARSKQPLLCGTATHSMCVKYAYIAWCFSFTFLFLVFVALLLLFLCFVFVCFYVLCFVCVYALFLLALNV